jgi:hypothetical protein
VDQRIVNALEKKEDLSKRINKDDLKLLAGNFKKKDKEAFKDVGLVEDVAEGASVSDEEEIQVTTEPDVSLSRDHLEDNNSSSGEPPLLF